MYSFMKQKEYSKTKDGLTIIPVKSTDNTDYSKIINTKFVMDFVTYKVSDIKQDSLTGEFFAFCNILSTPDSI